MSAPALSKGKRGSTAQASTMANGTSTPSTNKHPQSTASVMVESADAETPRTPWHEMNLKDLHRYRHAHRLHTPSSHKNPHARLIFAHAAQTGVNSPAVVAARRKQRESKKKRKDVAVCLKGRSSSRLKGFVESGVKAAGVDDDGKQTKEQLAAAVRKHFNAMSVSEGEVLARFIYVVRHAAVLPLGDQDKGFRARFNP